MGEGAVRQMVVGALVVVASLLLPWLVGVGGSGSTVTGVDLWRSAIVVVAIAAMLVGAAFLLARADRPLPWLPIAATWFGLAFGVASLGLILEVIASVAPTGWLPPSWRRWVVGSALGPGAVACIVGAGSAGAAACGGWGVLPLHRVVERSSRTTLVGTTLAGASLVALLLARYQVWVSAGVGARTAAVHGWALPWLGPACSAALWLMAIAIAGSLAFRRSVGLYVAVLTAWLWSFVALVLVRSGSYLGTVARRADLPEALRDQVGAWVPADDADLVLSVGPGLTLAYLGSLGLLAGCGLLLWEASGRREDRA